MLTLAYIRVSTVEQESGYGIDAQHDRIVAYCTAKQLTAPDFYQESQSGEKIFNRAELNQMLARAEHAREQGTEVHVVFPGLDRLSRDLIDQEGVVLRCFERGIRLHSTLESENDTLDPAFVGDPMRTAIRQFFGIINQLDKAIIQRRLEGGLAKKASEGGFTGGRTPLGYRSVNKELIIYEPEAAAIRDIFALGRRGIINETIAGVISGTHPVSWDRRKVGTILAREDLYCKGLYRSRSGTKPVLRPDLIIVTDDKPPSCTAVDWDKMPAVVSLEAISVLCDAPYTQVAATTAERGIVVKWRKRQSYVAKADAQELVGIFHGA